METTDKDNVVPPENGSDVSESSADKTWDSEKYPAWQKSIGKEYWGNERLKGFASMKDVMESIVNPKSKAPERYEGIQEGVEEAMRKADLSQDEAKGIADAYSKLIPKKHTEEELKDIYGADWEQAESDFSKAVGSVFTDKVMQGEMRKLMNDPVVFEFVRIVGKNLGDSPNLDIGRQQVTPKKGSGDPFLDLLMGKS